MRSLIGLGFLTALAACTSIGEVPTKRLASVTLKNANGLPAGTAQLLAAGDKARLTIAAVGLGKGQHGVHLHAVGQCEAPGFTSAGGHLNPGAREHGADNPRGKHLGDLPNLTVSDAGVGSLVAELPGTSAEIEAALFDADGSALVIHAAPDDYRTDPSGNSGARIACGVLVRK